MQNHASARYLSTYTYTSTAYAYGIRVSTKCTECGTTLWPAATQAPGYQLYALWLCFFQCQRHAVIFEWFSFVISTPFDSSISLRAKCEILEIVFTASCAYNNKVYCLAGHSSESASKSSLVVHHASQDVYGPMRHALHGVIIGLQLLYRCMYVYVCMYAIFLRVCYTVTVLDSRVNLLTYLSNCLRV